MVVPKEILVGQISKKSFEKKGGAYLESYALFDIYEGAQIKKGFKSVAYSMTYSVQKIRHLEEAEITGAMNKILKGLEALWVSNFANKQFIHRKER